MPQHEFELYLKLLANLLDLAPSQREEIRDELRDHLEERLAELARLGVSREEAIERALDEFGDAAGLAGSFTKLACERQRRRFMYRTTGTAVAVTLALLVAAALWPDGRGHNAVGPANVGAQDGDFGGAAIDGEGAEGYGEFGGVAGSSVRPVRPAARPLRPDPGAALRAEVEEALDQPVTVAFEDLSVEMATKKIAMDIDVDVLFDRTFFQDSGLDLESPVSLVLSRNVPARVALGLVLHELGDGEVGCVAREGFVYVTSMLETLQLEVYDVRDLTGRGNSTPRAMPQPGAGGGFLGGAGGFGSEAGMLGGMDGTGMGGRGSSMYGGSSPLSGGGNDERANVDALVHVILTNTARDTWQDVGGAGTISAFDGLLVVRNTPRANREVRQLLDMLRAANVGAARGRRGALGGDPGSNGAPTGEGFEGDAHGSGTSSN